MNIHDMVLERIRQRSLAEAELLAGEFARCASEEKEDILAALEFEKWLAAACADLIRIPGRPNP